MHHIGYTIIQYAVFTVHIIMQPHCQWPVPLLQISTAADVRRVGFAVSAMMWSNGERLLPIAVAIIHWWFDDVMFPAHLTAAFPSMACSYFCTIITRWTFLLVPFVSLMFEIQPVKFGHQFALAASLYLFANFVVSQNHNHNHCHDVRDSFTQMNLSVTLQAPELVNNAILGIISTDLLASGNQVDCVHWWTVVSE